MKTLPTLFPPMKFAPLISRPLAQVFCLGLVALAFAVQGAGQGTSPIRFTAQYWKANDYPNYPNGGHYGDVWIDGQDVDDEEYNEDTGEWEVVGSHWEDGHWDTQWIDDYLPDGRYGSSCATTAGVFGINDPLSAYSTANTNRGFLLNTWEINDIIAFRTWGFPPSGSYGSYQVKLYNPSGVLIQGNGPWYSGGSWLWDCSYRLNMNGTYRIDISYMNVTGTSPVNGTVSYYFNVGSPPPIPPVITTQPSPASQTVSSGATVSYTVGATNATSYQWKKDDAPIAGATSATLTLTNVQPASSGTYTVVVGNSGGSITSSGAVLTVNQVAPAITSGTSASGTYGTAFSYSITATNAPTSYSASGLPGGLTVNTATGVLSGTPTQTGTFTVTIGATNATGTGTAALVLTINAPVAPSITMQPANQAVASGIATNTTLTAMSQHSLALKTDGTVWSWGANDYGQLGDGTTVQRTTPVQVSGLSGVTSIDAGGAHNLAQRNDGTWWNWGNNGFGQLGDSTTTTRLSPIQFNAVNSINSMSAGVHFTMVLKGDGTVWSLGYNAVGQLGDGTTTNRMSPVQASGLSGVVMVSAGVGYNSLALKSDGTVWAWGANYYGELGDGTTTSRSTPVQVLNLTGVKALVTAQLHDLALKNDGTVWAWGANFYGQLGDGTNTDRAVPVQVSGLTGMVGIASSGVFSVGLKNDGTVWAWGNNAYGALGDGTTTNRSTPVQVSGLSGIVTVAAGYAHALALKNDGTVWAWGWNAYGQLGDGTTTDRTSPGQVAGLTGVALTVGGGSSATFTVTATGNPAPTYQWQRKPAGQSSFADLANGANYSGVTTATLTVSGQTTAMNGDQFRCTVINSAGSATSTAATLSVGAPMITSATNASAAVGTAFNYAITTTGTAVSYGATGLPAGLALNPATGVISGTPTASGTFNATLSATNSGGTGIAALALTVSAGTAQSITFPAIATHTYGDAPFTLSAMASSGLPVSYTIASGPATVSGSAVTLTGTGTVTITATQSGGLNGGTTYAPASVVSQTFTVAKANQTISFGPLSNKTYGDAPFALSATASSGLPVSFAATSGPATLAGNTVTLTGTGAVTITASQPGNTNYNAASSVSQSFAVNPPMPVVTCATNATCVVGAAFNYTITATNLPTSYSVTGPLPSGLAFNPSTGLISGTPTQTGTFTVTIGATNAGGTGTAPLSLVISAASQTITFGAIPSKATNDAPFALAATASSGLPVSFAVVSGPATVIGNTVTLTGSVGTVTIRASQAGSANYSPAPNVDQAFAVALPTIAPAITTQPTSQTATAGTNVSFSVVATGTPAPSYQWKKNGTAIGGAINATLALTNVQSADAGSYTVTATNSAGSVTSNAATLTVNTGPMITTQPAGQTVPVGGNVTFTVVATGAPAPGYQWRKDGASLAGATSSSYTLTSVQSADAAGYSVIVSNSIGSVISNTATLTVTAVPPIRLALQYWQPGDYPNYQSGGHYGDVWVDAHWDYNAEIEQEWYDNWDGGYDQLYDPDGGFHGSIENYYHTPHWYWVEAQYETRWIDDYLADGRYGSSWTTTIGAFGNPVGDASGAYNAANTNRGSMLSTYPINQILCFRAWGYAPAGNCSNYHATLYNPSGGVVGSGAFSSGSYWDEGFSPNTPGIYRVDISYANATGTSPTSGTVSYYIAVGVSVPLPPTITTQPSPTSQTISAGVSVSYTVGTSNAASYQWKKDGALLSGATSATLTFTNVQPGNSGTYTVVASNSGGSITSNSVTLAVNPAAPAITSDTITSGTFGAVFGYSIIATNYPTSYSASGLPGGLTVDSATGVISGTPTQIGSFTATMGATNGMGTGTAALTLTIGAQGVPSITTQPTSQTAIAGQSATFTVAATGAPAPVYQWKKNGTAIANATAASLTLTNVQSIDAGNYTVTATNLAGSVTSNAATLTVNPGPTITAQPVGKTVNVGGSATFTVSAMGAAPLSYQWQKWGANINGATSATLTLASVQPNDTGYYSVVVSNSNSSVTSQSVLLNLNGDAMVWDFIDLPDSANPGQTVTFTGRARNIGSTTWTNTYSPTISGSCYVYGLGMAGTPPGGTADLLFIMTLPTTGATCYLNFGVTSDTGAFGTPLNNRLIQTASYIVPNLPISSTDTINAVAGQSAVYQMTTSANPSWYTEFGLTWIKHAPGFFRFTPGSGLLRFTPTQAGSYTFNAYAKAASLAGAVKQVTLNVSGTASVTGANETGYVGLPFGLYRVCLTDLPAAYSLSGTLPPGLTFDSARQIISGTPSQVGSYPVTIRATNNTGGVLTANATITIQNDSSRPTVPQFFAASNITASSFTLSWQPSQTSNYISGYLVTVNGGGGWMAPNVTTAPVSGLTPGSTVQCTIQAKDGAGRLSDVSPVLAVQLSAMPPTITTQPQTQTVTAGGSVTFTVVAGGTAPLSYQWQKNGTAIAGATSATLPLSNVQASDAGSYTVVVSNSASSVASGAAMLTVKSQGGTPGNLGDGTIVGTDLVFPETDGTSYNAPPASWPNQQNTSRADVVAFSPLDFSVSASGDATTRIPIATTPGVAGMEPKISLVYSSSAANGYLGVGWSLQGVSIITRRPAMLAADGAIAPINLDANDHYTLDGQRLIQVTTDTSTGVTRTEYRTEIDSYSRIFAYAPTSGTNYGPERFEVYTKSGLKMVFGGTTGDTGSRLMAGAPAPTGAVLAWGIDTISDRDGNQCHFYYTKNEAVGEFYIESIRYVGAVGSENARLNFVYEGRTDVASGYQGGAPWSRTQRLKKIEATYGTTLARRYVLTYEDNPSPNTFRSRLGQVQEFDANGNPLPPMKFSYKAETSGWSDTDSSQYWPNLPLSLVILGEGITWFTGQTGSGFVDVDGDGIPDLLARTPSSASASGYIAKGSPSGWLTGTQAPQGFVPPWVLGACSGSTINLGVRFVDLDSDGYPDMVKSTDFTFGTDPQGGIRLNRADGWTPQTATQNWNLPFLLGSKDWDIDRGTRFVDLDGDGRVDVIYSRFTNGHQECGARRNNGHGWESFPNDCYNPPDHIYICASNEAAHGSESGIRILDINGDGLPDIVCNWPGVSGATAYINTGHGWRQDNNYAPPGPISATNGAAVGCDFIDVNGDGLPDQVIHDILYTDNVGVDRAVTYLNTGKGWVQADDKFKLPQPLLETSTKADVQRCWAIRFGVAFVDVNGDGLLDMVMATYYQNCNNFDGKYPLYPTDGTNTGGRGCVYLNTGHGWSSEQSYIPPCYLSAIVGTEPGGIDRQGNDIGTQLLDLRGNGMPDLVQHYYVDGTQKMGPVYYPPTKHAYLNNSDRPDLLETITHSSGLKTTITYSPLARNDGNFYTKGSRPSDTAQHPIDVQDARYAVRQITEADGLGGTYTLDYHYNALRQDLLEGSLGFESVQVTDSRTAKSVTTHYRQEYPYIGLPWKIETALASGRTVGVSTTVWDAQPNSAGVARVQAPYAKIVEEKSFDADSTTTAPYLVKTATVHSISMDWGDVTSQTTETSDGYVVDILRAITYATATSAFPGQISESTVTTKASTQAPLPAESKTRVTYLHFDATGHLDKEVRESINPASPPATGQSSTDASYLQTYLATDYAKAYYLATTYGYDSYGHVNSITVSSPGLDAPRTTTFEYSATYQGRFLTKKTNAENQTETLSDYDEALGVAKTHSDINSLPTTFVYDGLGRVTSQTSPGNLTATINRHWADPAHAPAGAAYYVETLPSGAPPSLIFYDQLARPLRTVSITADSKLSYADTSYDNRGNVAIQTRPYFSGATIYGTGTEYDVLGRVHQITSPDGISTFSYQDFTATETRPDVNYSPASGINHHRTGTIATTRNSQGVVVKVVESGTTTETNRATETLESTISYAYDPFGVLKKIVDPINATTSYTIDLYGRQTQADDPNRGTWSFKYNPLGEITYQKDARLTESNFTYDRLGRMTNRTVGTLATTWIYDIASGKGVGKLASLASFGGYGESASYDTLGRLQSASRTIGSGTNARTYTRTFGYDSYQRLSTITHAASGFVEKHVYSAYGHWVALRNGVTNGRYWLGTAFEADGQVKTILYGNGLYTDRVYRPEDGVIGSIVTGPSASPSSAQHLAYFYEPGRVGSLYKRQDLGQNLGERFTLDALGRLRATYLGTFDTIGTTPTAEQIYDLAGNLLSKTGVGAYNYTRPAGQGGGGGSHAVKSIGSDVYTYDANGNLLTTGDLSVSWTPFNQPDTITRGGASSSLTYDDDFQRARQVHAGETVDYAGAGHEHRITGSSDQQVHYLIGPFGRMGEVTWSNGASTDVRYFHHDHLSSVDTVTDLQGVPVRQSYDAWGERRVGATWQPGAVTPAERRGFTDHEHLDDLRIINMNGRIYDPRLGRFLSVDPVFDSLGQTQGVNAYSYVRNNPVSYTDPTGLAAMAADVEKMPTFTVTATRMNWRSDPFYDQKFGASLSIGFGGVATSATSRSSLSLFNQSFQNGGMQTGPGASGTRMNTDPVTPEAPNNAASGFDQDLYGNRKAGFFETVDNSGAKAAAYGRYLGALDAGAYFTAAGAYWKYFNTPGKINRAFNFFANGMSTAMMAGGGGLKVGGGGFVPRGFANAKQFAQASGELEAALARSGITDAQIGVRGSSVIGVSSKTGAPFSAASDIDFFVESRQLTEGFSTSKNIPGFVHPEKLFGAFPELEAWSVRWSNTLGRDVTPGGFTAGSISGTPMPQPFIWIK
jgi:RHS repeat-associated protein